MKARVKATGDIIEIREDCSYIYVEHYDKFYNLNELEVLDVDVKEKSLPKDEPNYWERLKHQYAGMAMQGILSNNDLYRGICKNHNLETAIMEYATALVNRLKEESQCEE